MDPQDYSDGSDDSDLDYKPPGEEEHLSEIDSDDPIDDDANNDDSSFNKNKKTTKKRTKKIRGSQKKFKKIDIDDDTSEKVQEVNTRITSSEENKKRIDLLWEEFQRPITKKSTSNATNTSEINSKLNEPQKVFDKPETTKTRTFESLFDGSDLPKKVENNDDTAKSKCPEPKSVEIAPIIKKSPGGLTNVLSQIGKKNKLTILEKSKQDWDGYKKKEGIVEELVTFNKGKDGYLEKRDFLERTDLRQFELEKAMRAANRLRRN